jgi:DNA-binding CsgD family transcriptional regulator/tetratricopeptide (TPR) repeat protein
LGRLTAELDNLRAALHAARSTGDDETLGQLAGNLWRYWYGLGFFTEGRLWVGDALPVSGGLDPLVRLDLLLGGASLAHGQGDDEEAETLVTEGLALARQQENAPALALGLNLAGVMARDHGDYDRAVSLIEESRGHARRIRDGWTTVLATNSLAILHQLRGDFEQAATLLEESAAIAREHGDTWSSAQALSNMAHLSRRQGDFERAAALYEESGALYREIGDRRGEAVSLTNLGRIAERRGEIDRAIELHDSSLEALRMLGDRRGMAAALANLGVAYLRGGDLEQADRSIRESLQLRHRLGDKEGISTSLEKLAEVEAAREQAGHALRLWAAAAALRDAIGAPLAPSERASYDIVLAAARVSLTDDQIATIWAEGRSISTEQAVAYALQQKAPPSIAAAVPTAPSVTDASGLTPRELDVLRLLEEHTDREIADQLYIGPRTVATHVTNILNKLGVNTRTAAVAYAIRHGFI